MIKGVAHAHFGPTGIIHNLQTSPIPQISFLVVTFLLFLKAKQLQCMNLRLEIPILNSKQNPCISSGKHSGFCTRAPTQYPFFFNFRPNMGTFIIACFFLSSRFRHLTSADFTANYVELTFSFCLRLKVSLWIQHAMIF